MSEQITKDREFFFIERTAFDKTFQELEKKKVPRLRISWIFSILVTLIISFFTTEEFVPRFGIDRDTIILVIILIIIILLLLLIIFLISKVIFKKQKKWDILTVDIVKEALERNAEELNIYNILLIIPNFSENKFTFLARKHTHWQNAIFLPYVQCNSKKEFFEFDNLDDKLHKMIITDINFKYEYLPELDIYNDVKYHKDEQYLRRYNYKFFLVYPVSNFLFNIFIDDLKKQLNYSFYNIDIIKNDIYSMMRNERVISKLAENNHFLQQKINLLNRNSNRLVWNISKQCTEKCEFCAFGDSINESLSESINIKLIIEQLGKIKIDKIDISTGDKIDINYLKNCIVELKKEGYKVGITATSKIINLLTIDFISENISMIEFTYDSLGQESHRSKYFNESNLTCIKKLSKDLRKKSIEFKALIILYSHLTIRKFREIVSKLKRHNINHITLIRLMPVGFMMEENKYPLMLKDKKMYDEYIDYCKNNNVIPHCSLDGFNSNIKYCNMGITKLSMGPSGNIYSCPWGEHLTPSNNKFCLGNILNDNIINIINNQKFDNVKNENFSCEIFNISMNEDYLYK